MPERHTSLAPWTVLELASSVAPSEDELSQDMPDELVETPPVQKRKVLETGVVIAGSSRDVFPIPPAKRPKVDRMRNTSMGSQNVRQNIGPTIDLAKSRLENKHAPHKASAATNALQFVLTQPSDFSPLAQHHPSLSKQPTSSRNAEAGPSRLPVQAHSSSISVNRPLSSTQPLVSKNAEAGSLQSSTTTQRLIHKRKAPSFHTSSSEGEEVAPTASSSLPVSRSNKAFPASQPVPRPLPVRFDPTNTLDRFSKHHRRTTISAVSHAPPVESINASIHAGRRSSFNIIPLSSTAPPAQTIASRPSVDLTQSASVSRPAVRERQIAKKTGFSRPPKYNRPVVKPSASLRSVQSQRKKIRAPSNYSTSSTDRDFTRLPSPLSVIKGDQRSYASASTPVKRHKPSASATRRRRKSTATTGPDVIVISDDDEDPPLVRANKHSRSQLASQLSDNDIILIQDSDSAPSQQHEDIIVISDSDDENSGVGAADVDAAVTTTEIASVMRISSSEVVVSSPGPVDSGDAPPTIEAQLHNLDISGTNENDDTTSNVDVENALQEDAPLIPSEDTAIRISPDVVPNSITGGPSTLVGSAPLTDIVVSCVSPVISEEELPFGSPTGLLSTPPKQPGQESPLEAAPTPMEATPLISSSLVLLKSQEDEPPLSREPIVTEADPITSVLRSTVSKAQENGLLLLLPEPAMKEAGTVPLVHSLISTEAVADTESPMDTTTELNAIAFAVLSPQSTETSESPSADLEETSRDAIREDTPMEVDSPLVHEEKTRQKSTKYASNNDASIYSGTKSSVSSVSEISSTNNVPTLDAINPPYHTDIAEGTQRFLEIRSPSPVDATAQMDQEVKSSAPPTDLEETASQSEIMLSVRVANILLDDSTAGVSLPIADDQISDAITPAEPLPDSSDVQALTLSSEPATQAPDIPLGNTLVVDAVSTESQEAAEVTDSSTLPLHDASIASNSDLSLHGLQPAYPLDIITDVVQHVDNAVSPMSAPATMPAPLTPSSVGTLRRSKATRSMLRHESSVSSLTKAIKSAYAANARSNCIDLTLDSDSDPDDLAKVIADATPSSILVDGLLNRIATPSTSSKEVGARKVSSSLDTIRQMRAIQNARRPSISTSSTTSSTPVIIHSSVVVPPPEPAADSTSVNEILRVDAADSSSHGRMDVDEASTADAEQTAEELGEVEQTVEQETLSYSSDDPAEERECLDILDGYVDSDTDPLIQGRLRSSSSEHPQHISRRSYTASSSLGPLDFADDDASSSAPQIHAPSSSGDASGGLMTDVRTEDDGFEVFTWQKDRKWIAKEFSRPAKLAEDIPHELQDRINSLPESARRCVQATIFEAAISENTADDEPFAPAIHVINNIDDEPTPPYEFHYSNLMWHGPGVPLPNIDALQGCDCHGECDPNPKTSTCACIKRQAKYYDQGFLYDARGRLREQDYPIFECNDMCGCTPECRNRVVQHGRKCEVVIKKTENKGWGVFAGAKRIPPNTFVGIYAGEYLTEDYSEQRGEKYNMFGRTYLFDLDFYHIQPPPPLDADWAPKYIVDAYHVGNFTRYLNHSCDPNCNVNACYINDDNFEKPLVTIFTCKEVAPGEELCFSYFGTESLDETESRKDAVYVTCQCGAQKCTGRMWK